MKLVYPSGATPLDPNELEGLLLPIASQGELDEAEFKAILTARLSYANRKATLNNFLSITSFLDLHREMLGDIWAWAGKFRLTDKSVGIAAHLIQVSLKGLLDNTLYRAQLTPTDGYRSLLTEFHHQLVAIHPFPNGNGRHGRLAVEILARLLKTECPSWGDERKLSNNSATRTTYIKALKMADGGNIGPLMAIMYPHRK